MASDIQHGCALQRWALGDHSQLVVPMQYRVINMNQVQRRRLEGQPTLIEGRRLRGH
jgi:hypothetical protein